MRTPRSVANGPGLPALRYRVGTYSDFVATMLARLSSSAFPALRGLRTRERSDWTIALLDAWAVAGDVLTFYQERIANEGYLGTATQLRSVVELARLVGYERRPGLAASTRLAFTLDPGAKAEIPTGTRARSVPGPGETAQTFETSAPLMARAHLNRLGLRPSRPQVVTATTDPLWLAGVDLAIKPADALLVRTAGTATPVLRRVAAVEEDRAAGRTAVRFSNPPKAPRSIVPAALPQLVKALAGEVTFSTAIGLIEGGAHELPPPFPEGSDAGDAHLRLLSTFRPGVAAALAGAWAAADATDAVQTQAWALRVRAPVFGHNAPPMIVSVDDETHAPTFGEWVPLQETSATQIDLDAPHDKMAAGDWAVVDYSGVPEGDHSLPSDGAGVKYGPKRPLITRVRRVIPSVSRQDYGMSATTARLELENEWINLTPPVVINGDSPPDLSFIRNTVVYTLAQELTLAEQPIDDDVAGDVLELDGLYEGIEPDRTLIVTGERTDVPGTTGVMATEVVEVMAVAHAAATAANATRPGDAVHTWVRLDQPLRYRYRRSSLVVYGNVAHATNGESRAEILGSGDGAKALQRFALRKPPLTFVSAPTPSGLASSLEVRVNDLRWPEVASLAELGPSTRGYVTQTDAAAVTSVVFGDGEHGRRLPTGAENVRARYRDGIGKQANVAAGAISLLATKPLGVKEVVNPVPATGGADADRVDQTRENAPLPLRALDRLVSLSDYADLARTFAGVGKAAANRLLDGRRQVVLVTVAGVDDIPLDPDGDVITNLLLALRRFGDPDVYLAVRPRELLLAQLELVLTLDADRDPDVVATAVRTAVAAALRFDARTLGQDLTESEVLRAVHRVPGVAWARLDRIEALRYADGTTEIMKAMESPDAAGQPYHPGRRILALEARTDAKAIAQPAQLLYLSAGIPETLAITVESAR